MAGADIHAREITTQTPHNPGISGRKGGWPKSKKKSYNNSKQKSSYKEDFQQRGVSLETEVSSLLPRVSPSSAIPMPKVDYGSFVPGGGDKIP